MDIKQFLIEQWRELGGAAGIFGTIFLFWKNKKQRKQESYKLDIESTDLMRNQLEQLNQKISELFEKQVSDAQENASLKITLNRLRLECPDCVGKILEIIENEKGN